MPPAPPVIRPDGGLGPAARAPTTRRRHHPGCGPSFLRTLDGERHRIGEVDYGDQGRARVMHQNRGLVRLYGEVGTELLIGAEMVGPRVEHTAHLLAWAIQQRLTVPQCLQLPFYHPVIEEGIRTALRNLKAALASPRSPLLSA